MKTHGIHHITAITADARRNIRFYTDVLGLRLVKKTINYDDPSAYHFYYGDATGSPGTILTFFHWADLPHGRPGAGQASATAYSVPAGSLPFWQKHLTAHNVVTREPVTRFGETVLSFADPDGLALELIAPAPNATPDPRAPWTHPVIPAEKAIRGFHSTTLTVNQDAATTALLTNTMGFSEHARAGTRVRYTLGNSNAAPALATTPGGIVDIITDASASSARQGSGSVHHVAFRVKNSDDQLAAREELMCIGLHASPQIQRFYFQSIYYREPAGILFELATDGPGFAIDESVEKLGSSLVLPPMFREHRAAIEAALPKLA